MHRLFLLPAILLALLSPQLAAAGDSCGRHHCCAKHSSKYRSGTAYDANLRRLEATFPGAVASSPHLSGQTTVGGPLAKGVVGFAFCRRGMRSSSCRACLARAFRDAKQRCPYGKDAAVDYGATCALHYYEDDPMLPFRKVQLSTDLKGKD